MTLQTRLSSHQIITLEDADLDQVSAGSGCIIETAQDLLEQGVALTIRDALVLAISICT